MTFYLLVLILLACVSYCFIALSGLENRNRGAEQRAEPTPGSPRNRVMHPVRPRLTIRSLMISIAVLAGLLAMHPALALIVIVLFVPYVSWIGARWLLRREYHSMVACEFWIAATTINVSVAVYCVAPSPEVLRVIFIGLWLTGVPTIASLGTVWISSLTRTEADTSRMRETLYITVIVLALMPSLTIVTLWPLHLAFLASRRRMESVARQVAAGLPVPFPRRGCVLPGLLRHRFGLHWPENLCAQADTRPASSG